MTSSRIQSTSIVGSGMRIDGDVNFSGDLRVDGQILGNVNAATDPEARIVVGESGRVIGSINVPHIVLMGRVEGHMTALKSIDIRAGGRATEGATYTEISIHAGGIVDGMLNHRADPAAATVPVVSSPEPDEPTAAPLAPQPPRAAATKRQGQDLWWAAIAVALALAIFWQFRGDPPNAPHPVKPVVDPPSAAPAPAPVEAAPAAVAVTPKAVTIPTAPPPAAPPPQPAPAAQPGIPASSRPAPGADNIVTLQGTNPEKSPEFFFLVTREPAVLYRKKRSDPGDGTRLEIATNRNIRLQIARDEVVRVAGGHDLDVFYQGRKVATSTIESGVWMSFVPAPAAE